MAQGYFQDVRTNIGMHYWQEKIPRILGIFSIEIILKQSDSSHE
jgi:hypothetical protein